MRKRGEASMMGRVIGVLRIDVDAATELGIPVTHSPTESNWGGVAKAPLP